MDDWGLNFYNLLPDPSKLIGWNRQAVVSDSGRDVHLLNGVLNSPNDVPALVNWNNTKTWYKDGELHRDGDRPAVVHADGDMAWYRHGNLHRDGGPARIEGKLEMWYDDDRHYKTVRRNSKGDVVKVLLFDMAGSIHNDDGPAVEHKCVDGTTTEEWWIFGTKIAVVNATRQEYLLYKPWTGASNNGEAKLIRKVKAAHPSAKWKDMDRVRRDDDFGDKDQDEGDEL